MTTTEIDLGEITTWRDDMSDDIIPPGFTRQPLGGGGEPLRWTAVHAEQQAAMRRQLHQVRGMAVLTMLLCLALLALTAVALNAPGGARPAGAVSVNAPRRVQLQIVGASPAAEVIGHIAYLDGSEAEFAPGAYDVSGLAGASIELTAGPGETLCRIVVDNVLVAEEFAVSGGVALCRWSAR